MFGGMAPPWCLQRTLSPVLCRSVLGSRKHTANVVYRESASLSAGPRFEGIHFKQKAADLAAVHWQLTLNSGSTARHASLRHCCSNNPAKLPRYCHRHTTAADEISSSSLAIPRETATPWPVLVPRFVYYEFRNSGLLCRVWWWSAVLRGTELCEGLPGSACNAKNELNQYQQGNCRAASLPLRGAASPTPRGQGTCMFGQNRMGTEQGGETCQEEEGMTAGREQDTKMTGPEQ